MSFLDRKAVEIDDLGKRLEEAYLDLGDKEAVWEEQKDIALDELVGEYEARPPGPGAAGDRLPGEDVRLARVRKRIGFEIYAEYRKAKRRVEGLEEHARKMETAISARQSLLKRMEAEENMRTFDPDYQPPRPQRH